MRRITSAVAIAFLAMSCAGSTRLVHAPDTPPTSAQMAEFWVDPGSRPRDLVYGVGGKALAPAKDAQYKFKGKDELGFSVSYDVEDSRAIEWSAKIGPEAQTEVVVSRLLWGLGYHQPPLYYVPSWTLITEGGDVKKESEARLRPKLDFLDRKPDYWSWQENAFVGTRPFHGLLVVLLILNSTDLKNDNNSIYELARRFPGDGPDVRRWFVVRDVGAALGETGKLFPRRNWIEGFEEEGFITGVKDGRIEFAYTGRHQELLQTITAADLRWAANRMLRLTDQQWRDAFRTANYTNEITNRYLRKIRQKIQEALKVAASAQATAYD